MFQLKQSHCRINHLTEEWHCCQKTYQLRTSTCLTRWKRRRELVHCLYSQKLGFVYQPPGGPENPTRKGDLKKRKNKNAQEFESPTDWMPSNFQVRRTMELWFVGLLYFFRHTIFFCSSSFSLSLSLSLSQRHRNMCFKKNDWNYASSSKLSSFTPQDCKRSQWSKSFLVQSIFSCCLESSCTEKNQARSLLTSTPASVRCSILVSPSAQAPNCYFTLPPTVNKQTTFSIDRESYSDAIFTCWQAWSAAVWEKRKGSFEPLGGRSSCRGNRKTTAGNG